MQTKTLSIAVLAALGLAGWALAQQSAPQLRAVKAQDAQTRDAQSEKKQSQDTARSELSKKQRMRLDALVEQLGSPDFEERRAAARKLAAEGKDIAGYLRRMMKGAEDPEQRWQLRKLLKSMDGDRSRLRRLDEDRSERRSDDRAPREERRFPRLPRQGGFGELEQELERMRQEMDEMMRRLRSGGFGLPPTGVPGMPGGLPEAMQRGQGTSVQVQPGKVTVEIREEKDGKVETKRYEAESMQELLRKYPQLKGRVGGVRIFGGGPGGFDFRMGPGFGIPGFDRDFDAQRDFDERRGLRDERSAAPAPNDRPTLGIYIRDEITPQLRQYLGLAADEGLWVQSTVKKSLAEQLGIQDGDIVIRLNGQKVGTAADVARALSEGDGKPRATVLRKGKKLELEAAEAKKDKSSDTKPKLRKVAPVRIK